MQQITLEKSSNEITTAFILEDSDLRELLGPRDIKSHKGSFGYTALVGGCLNYSGAIRLASMANCAMRSGAGVVKIALPRSLSYLILPDVLNATVFPLSDSDGMLQFDEREFGSLIEGLSVIAFGMGIGRSAEVAKALDFILKNFKGTLIIDADGLNELSEMGTDRLKGTDCKIVLTPHPKEFSRLSGYDLKDVLSSPAQSACSFAKNHNCTVLLKGHESIITDGERIFINRRGCAGMATAGSGDVLSGIIAAICGWKACEDVTFATAAAAYIAGVAGEIAEKQFGDISMTASDTADAIPKAIDAIRATVS